MRIAPDPGEWHASWHDTKTSVPTVKPPGRRWYVLALLIAIAGWVGHGGF